MSEPKFTKGEWAITKHGISYKYIGTNDSWRNFCRVVVRMIDGSKDDPEGVANVNLILSAPEMYSDLKSLINSICSHPDYINGSDDDEWHTLVNLANKTIAKAEGRQL